MDKYNGWTNYETWRVNLEIFDGMNPRDWGFDTSDSYDLGQCLKEYASDLIEQGSAEGLARDYALAFLGAVDYREIAEHMIEDYAEEEEEEEEVTE